MGGLIPKPKAPKIPTPAPAVPIPTADDEAIERRKLMRIAEAKRRGGRESTIMTDGVRKDTLGAG